MLTTRRAVLALSLVAGLAAPALAQDLVYFEEDGGAGPRGYYNFDSATGQSTLRAAAGGNQRFFGLEVQPSTGRVFATDVPATPCTLWNINIDDGSATLIGPINNDTIADIAFDPTTGRLYGMGRNDPFTLYSIDPGTGSPTNIANTSAAVRCGMVCSASGQLYAFSYDGILSRLDKNTGQATLVGGTSIQGPVEDATFTPDGRLFYTTFFGQIYQVNPATGQNTLVGTTGAGSGLLGIIATPGRAVCYANCDGSSVQPILNVNDFVCFQTKYAAGDSYANCDGSTVQPILNVNDFICFQTKYAAGCP